MHTPSPSRASSSSTMARQSMLKSGLAEVQGSRSFDCTASSRKFKPEKFKCRAQIPRLLLIPSSKCPLQKAQSAQGLGLTFQNELLVLFVVLFVYLYCFFPERTSESWPHVCPRAPVTRQKLFTLLDLCVSSLRRGHAKLHLIVPSFTDDPRRESRVLLESLLQSAGDVAEEVIAAAVLGVWSSRVVPRAAGWNYMFYW